MLASSFSVLIAIQVLGSYKETLTLNRLSYQDKVQTTIFQDVRGYAHESAYLFRDRNIERFLSSDEQRTVDSIDVWVNSYPTTVGIMASLKPEIPIIAVTLFQADLDSFDPLKTAAASERYEIARRAAAGKHLYTIAPEAYLDAALAYLKRAGLRPARIQMWQLPYYSHYTHMKVALIELENAESNRQTMPLRGDGNNMRLMSSQQAMESVGLKPVRADERASPTTRRSRFHLPLYTLIASL